MPFTARPTPHVYHFTGDPAQLCRVSPFKGPVIIFAHRLKKRRLTCILSVYKNSSSNTTQSFDQTGVNLRSLSNPALVSSGKSFGEIKPRPHDYSGANSEDTRIRCPRNNGFDGGPTVLGPATTGPAIPCDTRDQVDRSCDQVNCQIHCPPCYFRTLMLRLIG